MTYTNGDFIITDPALGALALVSVLLFVGVSIALPVIIREWLTNRKSMSDPNGKVSL